MKVQLAAATGTVAAVVALALPAAPATAASCARSAKVTSGTVVVPGYTAAPAPADGSGSSQAVEPVRDPSKDRPVHRLTTLPVLVTSSHATVAVQHVRYRLDEGSIVRLGCFGESKAEGAIFPSLDMFAGSAVVRAPAGHPGAIMTTTALVNPYARAGQRFSVKLVGTSPDAVGGGTTEVRKVGGAGTINITPYVGPSPGTCRQVRHSARLVSPDRHHRHGAAYYDGRLAT